MNSIIPLPNLAHLAFARLDTRELARGKGRPRPEDIDGWARPHMDHSFNYPLPADMSRAVGVFCDFYATVQVHADCLAAGPGHVRHFALTNVRTTPRVEQGGDSAVVGIHGPSQEDARTPYWSFTAYSREAKWDPKAKEWDDGDKGWQKEQSLEVSFREPFRVFDRGRDYYFLTDSGSLYRAPPPAKAGWTRRVTRVYDGRQRRVMAVVTDADAKRTFLFVPPAAEGGKRAFFELSDKPKLVEYNPKLVPLPPPDEPHRTVVHAVRVLVALKKIAGKLPATGEKQRP